ncbi:MAG TPA: GDP-mannose 4,6-dehydratase [Mycobacteriales bacterium]|nr:GDP-mannose 4,6-dehydratase [Mycobacteriales bacterium]
MRCLVTGAGGFIGSHLTEALLAEGHEVRALVRYSSTGSWGFLGTLRGTPGLEVIGGDVRDPRQVRQLVDGVDVVHHLAALIGIPYSYEAPHSYVATNVEGTLNVLDAARDAGTSRVVITSTSEVYGTALSVPITEDHPRQAQSPYSATKIGADALAIAWARSFDLPVVVLRPFNTYGPRQSARAVIPTILGQLLAGATELRLGSLHPQRDLTEVSDTVRGFLLAMTADAAVGREVHLGTGSAVSIGELAELCQDVVGVRVPIVTEDARVRPSASEVELLLSDNRLAAELLGWSPQVSLRDGLVRTAGWLREHRLATTEYAR